MGGTELLWPAQLPYSHEVVGMTPVQVEQGSLGRGSPASSDESSTDGIWAGGGVFVARLSFSQTTSRRDQREQTHIRSASPGRGFTPPPFKVVVAVLVGSITGPPNNTDKAGIPINLQQPDLHKLCKYYVL